jgi:hypothetical protein
MTRKSQSIAIAILTTSVELESVEWLGFSPFGDLTTGSQTQQAAEKGLNRLKACSSNAARLYTKVAQALACGCFQILCSHSVGEEPQVQHPAPVLRFFAEQSRHAMMELSTTRKARFLAAAPRSTNLDSPGHQQTVAAAGPQGKPAT